MLSEALEDFEFDTGLWLAGNEGMEKIMETTTMGLYRIEGLGFKKRTGQVP